VVDQLRLSHDFLIYELISDC